MPKDPTRNQPNYKIDGGHLNEYEFAQSHGAITEEERQRFADQQRQGGDQFDAPQTEAERIQQLMTDVRERVQHEKVKEAARAAVRRQNQGSKKSGARAKKKGGVKKSANVGAAKSTTAQRSAKAVKIGATAAAAASKSGAKKRVARKSSATKSSAKSGAQKSGAKAGAKKGAAKKSASSSSGGGARAAGKQAASKKGGGGRR